MLGHLRANLVLLVLTVLLCCGVYPLILLGASLVFRRQAEGSLLHDKDQKPIGSELIAQPFTDDAPEYFQPRPSAVSYNAAASGASNYAANNVLLRDRVARQLGPIVTYKVNGPGVGARVGPDVQDWFCAADDRLAQWAGKYPALAKNWINQDKVVKDYVAQWSKDHHDTPEYGAWRRDNPDALDPEPADLATPFFASFARERHKTWLTLETRGEDGKPLIDKDNQPAKRIKLVEIEPTRNKQNKFLDDRENAEVQAYFFEFYLQEHRELEDRLEQVPADLVMASASGLDPHITLDNAHWQLRHRVAEKRAARLVANQAAPLVKGRPRQEIEAEVRRRIESKLGKPLQAKVAEDIESILQTRKTAPFGGLAGVDLVNVLDVNRAVDTHMEELAKTLQ